MAALADKRLPAGLGLLQNGGKMRGIVLSLIVIGVCVWRSLARSLRFCF